MPMWGSIELPPLPLASLNPCTNWGPLWGPQKGWKRGGNRLPRRLPSWSGPSLFCGPRGPPPCIGWVWGLPAVSGQGKEWTRRSSNEGGAPTLQTGSLGGGGEGRGGSVALDFCRGSAQPPIQVLYPGRALVYRGRVWASRDGTGAPPPLPRQIGRGGCIGAGGGAGGEGGGGIESCSARARAALVPPPPAQRCAALGGASAWMRAPRSPLLRPPARSPRCSDGEMPPEYAMKARR